VQNDRNGRAHLFAYTRDLSNMGVDEFFWGLEIFRKKASAASGT